LREKLTKGFFERRTAQKDGDQAGGILGAIAYGD
jgi:hypothetical protein